MQIIIPHPNKKRALLVIDVQQGFVTEENAYVLPSIKKVISEGDHAIFVEATFYADKGSIWDKQMEWIFPHEPTIAEVKELLPADKTISVKKSTKSVFLEAPELASKLKDLGIEEIHIIGFDTNDCILASAYMSFDLGFTTYVIEEATGSHTANELKQMTLKILQEVEMTNHSELIKDKKEI